jgi:membrane-bound lytic murein transglycosylase D
MAALPAMLDHEPVATDDASVLDPVDLLGGREFNMRRRNDDNLLPLLPSYKKRRSLRDPIASFDGDRERIERLLGNDRAETSDDDEDDRDEARARKRRHRKARQMLVYRVGPGDTLIGIARQFAVDAEDVARDNNIDEGDKLKAGALLKLRVAPGVLQQQEAQEPGQARQEGEDGREGKATSEHRDEAQKRQSSQKDDDGAGKSKRLGTKGRGRG